MTTPRLAAIIYELGCGDAADAALLAAVGQLRAEGLAMAGAIQHNVDRADRCLCDMVLEDLGSGRHIEISEFRGPEARGCRLDTVALEEAAGLATASLDRGAALVIVNRFGKREAAGHGFRQLIEAAVARGVPVIVAVSRDYAGHWRDFSASLDSELAADPEVIARWARSATGMDTALRAASAT